MIRPLYGGSAVPDHTFEEELAERPELIEAGLRHDNVEPVPRGRVRAH
jgi:hypothetical protein